MGKTSIKNRFFKMKGDIGMANYEKRVEQEAAYPIPISLYNCYIQDSELLLIYSVSHASLSCNSCTKI